MTVMNKKTCFAGSFLLGKWLLVVPCILALPSFASAQTVFSLNNDFSLATNLATNRFHYGEQSDFGQSFTLFTNSITNGVPGNGTQNFSGWISSGDGQPFIEKQISLSNTVFGGKTYSPGELMLHPDTNANAVIRFLAPASGNYTVNATWQLRGFGNNSDGVDVRLMKAGGVTALSSAVLGGGGRGSNNPSSFTMNTTTFLSTGEILEFSLGRLTDAASDTTALSGTVTLLAAPEPSTLALGVLGLGAAAVLRRRMFTRAI